MADPKTENIRDFLAFFTFILFSLLLSNSCVSSDLNDPGQNSPDFMEFMDYWSQAWNLGTDLQQYYSEEAKVYQHPGLWMGNPSAIVVFFELDMERSQNPWLMWRNTKTIELENGTTLLIHEASTQDGSHMVLSLLSTKTEQWEIQFQAFLPLDQDQQENTISEYTAGSMLEPMVMEWLEDGGRLGPKLYVEKWYDENALHMGPYGVNIGLESLAQSFSLLINQPQIPRHQIMFHHKINREKLVVLQLLPWGSPIILIFDSSHPGSWKILFEASL